jgi:ribosome-associated protein
MAKKTSKPAVSRTRKPSVKKTTAPKKSAASKSTASGAKKKSASRKKAETDESLVLAQEVVNGILEKKGKNITCLDLRNVENAVCEFFILCEGDSTTQINAIAESVEYEVKKKLGARPYHSEGWENALWILIDYVTVVVHVFEQETRRFYNLESLWADAEEITFVGQEHSKR